MEAKVDIRKLQVLNDRINQTLEALNQVRLTVHGLGHSSPYGQGFGSFGTPGYGQGFGSPGYGQGFGSPGPGSMTGQSFGQQPFGFGMNPFTQGLPGIGLQHTNPYVNPYVNPYGNPFTQGIGQTGMGMGLSPQSQGWSQQPWNVGQQTGGLFHSNDVLERLANDPSRIFATFPYAMSPQNPQQQITW